MDKGLQEVINKLNSQKPQKTEKAPETPKIEVLQDEEDDKEDVEFYEDDEQKKEEELKLPKLEKPVVSTIEKEMELLQNNGRFRAEILFQLQELNKTQTEIKNALIVIAQILSKK